MESLSPEQQRFAKAYRGMQVSFYFLVEAILYFLPTRLTPPPATKHSVRCLRCSAEAGAGARARVARKESREGDRAVRKNTQPVCQVSPKLSSVMALTVRMYRTDINCRLISYRLPGIRWRPRPRSCLPCAGNFLSSAIAFSVWSFANGHLVAMCKERKQ